MNAGHGTDNMPVISGRGLLDAKLGNEFCHATSYGKDRAGPGVQ
jgi:hypothetical protein